MLNRTPTNTSNTINAYRKKRQQKGPFLMYGAIALVVIGLVLLILWLMKPDQPLGQMFATETPTPTVTFTPTSTSTPTLTATITRTPTVTLTATPSGPFDYVIQEGNSLESIAQKFSLGDNGSLLLYYQNQAKMDENGGVIFVGQTIIVPPPGSVLPTSTPIPPDLPRGTKIEYQVLPGDTLAGIAAKFNSKQENILTANPEFGEDVNALKVGQKLQIPVNVVTPTATLPPTSTPNTPTVVGGQPTAAATTAASTAAAGTTPAATRRCGWWHCQLCVRGECRIRQPAAKIDQRRTRQNGFASADRQRTIEHRRKGSRHKHALQQLSQPHRFGWFHPAEPRPESRVHRFPGCRGYLRTASCLWRESASRVQLVDE